MKLFIQTSIAAAVFIIVAVLFIALHKIENYKKQVEQQKETIYELKEELHTYQVQYLEGKLKFCKTK